VGWDGSFPTLQRGAPFAPWLAIYRSIRIILVLIALLALTKAGARRFGLKTELPNRGGGPRFEDTTAPSFGYSGVGSNESGDGATGEGMDSSNTEGDGSTSRLAGAVSALPAFGQSLDVTSSGPSAVDMDADSGITATSQEYGAQAGTSGPEEVLPRPDTTTTVDGGRAVLAEGGAEPGLGTFPQTQVLLVPVDPISILCGPNTCNVGELCCNESCGICVAPGASCTHQRCDGITIPFSSRCGLSTCNVGQTCCDPTCGLCSESPDSCRTQHCPQ
jgi:hypothetical protein